MQATRGRSSSKPDLYAPSPVTPEGPRAPVLDPKLGYSGSLLSESLDGANSSLDDGELLRTLIQTIPDVVYLQRWSRA